MRPLVSGRSPERPVEDVRELSDYAPFYGWVKLRDGHEYECTVLSAGDSLRIRTIQSSGRRYFSFAPDDVLRVQMYATAPAWAQLAAGAIVGGLLGGMTYGIATAACSSQEFEDGPVETDWDTVHAWTTGAFVWGAAGILLARNPDECLSLTRRVNMYSGGRSSPKRARLPSPDWDDWPDLPPSATGQGHTRLGGASWDDWPTAVEDGEVSP